MTVDARLIALDWGTSSLRAYLLGDGGTTLDEVAKPWGIMAVPDGDFAGALNLLTGHWRQERPDLPAIACGMIGSAQGWRETAYVRCPAGPDDLIAAMRRATPPDADIPLIVPGVALDGALPDVMRGEETQVLGCLARLPELAAESTLVLPGTHSKWASIRDGRIASFSTYMTGELFSLLSRHSILGRPAQAAGKEPRNDREAAEAFDWGVRTILDNPRRGLSSLLFSVRTQVVLSARLPAANSLDYLSGLLVADELRNAIDPGRKTSADKFALIGDPALCGRYQRAFELFGAGEVPAITNTAQAGLWRLAEAAFHGNPVS
jgi:2-dehydro-3-deoxygalactonokinase